MENITIIGFEWDGFSIIIKVINNDTGVLSVYEITPGILASESKATLLSQRNSGKDKIQELKEPT